MSDYKDQLYTKIVAAITDAGGELRSRQVKAVIDVVGDELRRLDDRLSSLELQQAMSGGGPWD